MNQPLGWRMEQGDPKAALLVESALIVCR